jgi:hypothetical protein
MATEIQSWQIMNGKLVPLRSNMIQESRKETDDLEQWLRTNSEILGKDIVIIGEQVNTRSGCFMDFLGIDINGNPVVIELKRDKLPRVSLAQAIDYASDIATWDIEKYSEICLKYTSKTLEEYLSEKIEGKNIDELIISQSIRILLVGFSIEESLSRMIEWLSNTYNISINAIVLNYIKTINGEELLSRTMIIPEEIDHENANKKSIIQKSNEPGQYTFDELKIKLIEYFNKDLYSAKRIKEHLLPILIENKKVTREQLKKELVKRNVATDEGEAGSFVSLISSQLSFKWNDYLRQIIYYEFPNYKWEKDNFSLNENYKGMITEIIDYKNTKNGT